VQCHWHAAGFWLGVGLVDAPWSAARAGGLLHRFGLGHCGLRVGRLGLVGHLDPLV
jgi:hypothetical protein